MSRRFTLVVVLWCVVLVVLMQVPHLLRASDPRYKGIVIPHNSDESVYLARVQEALDGRPEQSAEAFVGHPGLVGTQFALIEMAEGTVFRWTGLRAAEVFVILDSVTPVLVFLSLLFFLQLAGFRKWHAFAVAVAFCIIELYNLNRPVHMRESFFLMMLALITITLAMRLFERRGPYVWWSAAAGAGLLGLLVGVYFWSFSFAWLWWGIFLLFEFVEWVYGKFHAQSHRPSRIMRWVHAAGSVFWHFRPRKPSMRFERWHILAFIGVAGVVAALPFVAQHLQMSFHPLYDQGVFRSGMRPSHAPESWPYSILFCVMAVTALVASLRDPEAMRPYRPAVVTVITAFLFINQQAVHGVVFNFISHSIFSLALAAICSVLLAVTLRKKLLMVGAVAACIYLAAIGYDGRYVLGQWQVRDSDFADQHLAGLLPFLDALPRSRILSDQDTSAFIAAFSKHDIVFSTYLKNVLMTHEELANRFCLQILSIAPDKRAIHEREHLIFPDASDAFGSEVRKEEERIVEERCRAADLDAARMLKTYEVGFVLWNTVSEPGWDLRRLQVPLTEVARGDGWILFRIIE